MQVQIPLTQGQFTLIDGIDRDAMLTIGKWCYSSSGYAVHYCTDDAGKRRTLYMHRVIMQRVLGGPIPAGYQVDHISGATQGKLARLDNRRENLRLATRSQNQAHKGRGANNTSEYKGVSFNQGKWEARIKYQDQRLNLGRFKYAITAAWVYDAASRLLYGEFAGLNFPDLPTPPHLEAHVRTILERYGILTRRAS